MLAERTYYKRHFHSYHFFNLSSLQYIGESLSYRMEMNSKHITVTAAPIGRCCHEPPQNGIKYDQGETDKDLSRLKGTSDK